MKKILPLTLLLILTTTGFAWPWGTKDPQPKPTPVATPKPTVSEGRDIIKQIGAELKAAKEENVKLKDSLTKASQRVNDAEAKTVIVQQQADNLKEWGVVQQAEAHKYMEKYNNAVKRYHRLKLIAALIAAAVGVLVGIQFINLAPPPYNLGIPFGGAAFFAALVWFFL